ncbi:MAG: hypothetical protein A3K19_14315 [Lentisphaerae bacterium RIFOXYB12_FULL_65_16]|nr:MAG: hypothetical protein A3K18_18360 [Lentisphaerae bacterium RIFOXYA12_64_32]OGV87397.1 MAG: hypothetical protein A3K19_14315 [Lentisphaerae bacterium RIFOXYB12_FULL_65_16]
MTNKILFLSVALLALDSARLNADVEEMEPASLVLAHWDFNTAQPPKNISLFQAKGVTLTTEIDPEAVYPEGKGTYKVVLTQKGENSKPWDVQLHFPAPNDIQRGKAYRVTLWLRSDQPNQVSGFAVNNQNPLHVTATQDWQRCTIEFKSNETKTNADVPDLFLGDLALNSPVWVGSVRVEELPGGLPRVIRGTEEVSTFGTVTLHLDFENDNWAAFSRNQEPMKSFGSDLVGDRHGKAASIFNNSECGGIGAVGDLEKARGTAMFWYKPSFPNGPKANYSLLISGNHGGISPTRIWLWNGNIRYDYSQNGYLVFPIADWQPNEWKHIACSWDNTQGAAIAVDGSIVAEKAESWPIANAKTLIIGGDGARTCADGLLDDLLVFNVPLSEKQMKEHYQGTLKYSYATPLEKKELSKQSEPVFALTFDEDMDALEGKDSKSPARAENVALTPGYRGQAVKLGKESALQYAGNSLMTRVMGTASFWLKLDREPTGNGFPIKKADFLKVPRATVFTLGDTTTKDNIRLAMDDFFWLNWSEKGQNDGWGSLHKQLFVNEWHNYVVTWDAGAGHIALYFDGKMLVSDKTYELGTNDLEHILLGKASADTPGMEGALDELLIYNYAMTSAAVLDLYSGYEPVVPALMDYCCVTKRPNTIRMKWLNIAGVEQSAEFSVVIKDPAQQVLFEEQSVVSLLPGKELTESFTVTPVTTGTHTLCIYRNGELYRKRELLAIDDIPVAQGRPLYAVSETPEVHVLDDIDCAKEYGAEKYRDDLKTRVVTKDFGRYRESSTDELSGFAYRIAPLSKPGTPHWLEVDYPDDAMRTFYVVVLQEKYNHVDAKGFDTIGIITGGNFPLSMKMQKKRLLFWPDSPNIMVGCYQYHKFENQSGPALARIQVCDNNGPLPVLKTDTPENYPQRKIGVWNEDPTMPGYAWFNQDTMYDDIGLDFWRIKYQRTLEYLLYSGQNEWDIMCSEYNGDIASDPFILPRSQIGSCHGYIPGWAHVSATMLERDKIDFFASVHAEFRDTSGAVAAWFGSSYNTDIFEVDLMGEKSVNRMRNDNSFVNGSTSVDPLHPLVQDAHVRMVKAYCEMFKPYQHFKGIRFISGASSLYYSDITEGYGDYDLEAFGKDTGITVPVASDDKKRFAKRYQWLMENAKEQWIDWRCREFAEYYGRLRDAVCQDDPTRSFGIYVMNHMRVAATYDKWPSTELSVYEYFRQCGIDMKMLAKEKGISITPSIAPYLERSPVGDAVKYAIRAYSLSPDMSPYYQEQNEPAAFFAYHGNMEQLPFHKPKIADYWWDFGSWFGRKNGPHHIFSSPQPPDAYAREFFTHVLAEYDPQRITHGWWGCPDNGNIAEAQRFYAAFRSIPAVKFEDVLGAEDPVRVRYWHGNGESFVYLVNRESYPVQYSMSLTGVTVFTHTQDGSVLSPVADGDHCRLDIALPSYDVTCLRGKGTVGILGTTFSVPEPVVRELEEDLDRLGKAIAAAEGSGADVTAVEAVQVLAQEALEARRYAQFRHLLQSGRVLKLKARLQSQKQ